jgi:FkbM family methyltransferase
MKCFVITPLGPGHHQVASECHHSVQRAIENGTGAFSEVHHLIVDDSLGKLGRSKARNIGVRKALESGADWIFFLDADDGLLPGAFRCVASHLDTVDAVWGQIWEQPLGQKTPSPRLPQVRSMDSLEDLLLWNPFMTIQIGHFVRARIAEKNPFREDLDAGEDFEYYLRVWRSHRAVKIVEPFFVNRRGMPSSGPRSADGDQWRKAVEASLAEARLRSGVDPTSPESRTRINRRTLEYRDFLHGTGVAPEKIPAVALSHALPFLGPVSVDCYPCTPFWMTSENDDLVVSQILWNKTFEPHSLRVWIALCRQKQLILDIGAYTGLYGLCAASLVPNASIVCFEPVSRNAARIRQNIALNSLGNIRCEEVAVSNTESTLALNVFSDGDFLTSGSSLVHAPHVSPKSRLEVKTVRLDKFLHRLSLPERGIRAAIKIDVEGAESAVLEGFGASVHQIEADFIIEILSEAAGTKVAAFFEPLGYRFYQIREDVPTLTPVTRLAGSGDLKDLNRLITRKSPAQLREEYGLAVADASTP